MALLSASLLAGAPSALQAQQFDDFFEDATLRIDYVMAGNVKQQNIYLESLMKQEKWAGRKSRLAETPLAGNGQLIVKDHATQQIIYTWTFSTLFQEWLQYDEATRVSKAFDASYNIPYPKKPVDVTISLTDSHNKVTTEMTHTIDPTDILIRPIGNNGIPFHYVWKGKGQETTATSGAQKKNGNRNFTPTPNDPFAGVNITDCIDIAIVAEGYSEQDMGKFYEDCQRAVDALFGWEPFRSMKDRFNVVAVAAPSQQTGPTVPHQNIWHNTPSKVHYDTFYSNRYLMTQEMHALYDLLSGVPFEHVIVLVNSDTYGGGGIYNQITVSTSNHPTFKEVLVHEFGHAYGGLGDEYAYDDMDTVWYPSDTEPWEPNISTLKDFKSKWADMLPENTPIPTPLNTKLPDPYKLGKDPQKARQELNAATQVLGVFEGAGYQTKGCYRPAQVCRMRINEVEDFCPVCQRAIRSITDFYTSK
ncbi:MAG: M64 family metallopeptidase [Bacteroidales bacterium]|nr:M64 family metallopeptidase [Bacteroidales bacterium]